MSVTADAVAVALNALILVLALPLAMRLVPINYFYGYRTARSTANEEAWYALNAAFGKVTVAVTGAALAAGAVMLGVRYGTELSFWEYGFAMLYVAAAVAVVAGVVVAGCACRANGSPSEEE